MKSWRKPRAARGGGAAGEPQGRVCPFSGTKRTVIDGPFAETKELIAGFWLWQVKSKERRSSGSSVRRR